MKKDFYDIIPNEKRTIRNIPITKKTDTILEPSLEAGRDSRIHHTSHQGHHSMDGIKTKSHSSTVTTKHETRSEKRREVQPEVVDEDFEVEQLKQKAPERNINQEDDFDSEESFEEWRKGKKSSFWRGWATIGFLIVAGVVIFSLFFGSATITINPVKHDLVLKETTISIDSIKHEQLSTEISKDKEVVANGTVKVDRKATGKVVLYNSFNSSTQKLVEGTRLETPNGLIYKLKSTVVIPAQKTTAGKKVPGSIEADVEASETGEKYNQGFKDFNVVAYKGSDRYDTIYGRSKTALANGYSGVVPNILTKDINTAVAEIKEAILKEADEYFEKKAKSKGDTFVYIPTTKEVTYGETKQEVSKNGKTATISINAKITATLFDSTELFEQIIKTQTETTNSEGTASSTSIEDASAEIVYTGETSKLKVDVEADSKITVSGATTISSAIDAPKVKKAVSGLEKEQAIGAIKRLVELENIEIDIRPWWNKKLPSSDKIEIKTEE